MTPTEIAPSLAADEFERQRLELFSRRGFEATGRRVSDRQGRGIYLLEREGGDRPTVLVHGGLSQAAEWALVAGGLRGRIVIADRPGCGLSYPIDYRGVDYRQAAVDWLEDLLDGIGADEVDLVGHSMGGYFCIAFAFAHPARVRRLALVGSPAGLTDSVPLFVRLWGNPVTGPLIRRIRITDPEILRKRVYGRLLVAKPHEVPLELLELDIAAAGLPGVDMATYTMLLATCTLRGFRPSLLLRDDVVRLAMPSLFLWGDRDSFLPPSTGEGIAAHMADAAVRVIPEAGHCAHLDRPDLVGAAIDEFFAQ